MGGGGADDQEHGTGCDRQPGTGAGRHLMAMGVEGQGAAKTEERGQQPAEAPARGPWQQLIAEAERVPGLTAGLEHLAG